MTAPQTPETTPAVQRADDARTPIALSEPGTYRFRLAHTMLAAALATECHEAVVDDDGEEQPCNAYAVAYREDVEDDAVLGVYPVCETHARPPLVPLTTAILGGSR